MATKRAAPKRVVRKKRNTTKKKTKPKSIRFNARGDRASPYRSSAKSKAPTFCKIPDGVMVELSEMFDVEDEMLDIAAKHPDWSFCEILTEMLPAGCMRGWRITRFLGNGIAGYVFGCRSKKEAKGGALKIQHVSCKKSMQKEIDAHRMFTKLGLSPKILFHCTTRVRRSTVFFTNMERIDTTVDHWLEQRRSKKVLNLFVERLFDIFKIMSRKGLTHGDFHTGNIGFVYNREGAPGKIQVLDHSYTTTKGSLTEIDLVQFMRTLHRRYNKRAHRESTNYLLDRCKQEAKSRYGLKISRSLTYLEERFSKLRSKLRRMKSKSK